MIVYVITEGDYSDYRINAVFTDKDKAEEYVKYWNQLGSDCEIEEYEANVPLDKPEWIQVIMKENGDSRSFEWTEPEGKVQTFSFAERRRYIGIKSEYETYYELEAIMNTDDPVRAVKVTNELRAFAIANNVWGDTKSMAKLKGWGVREV